jgi:hypothetical protein
MRPCVLQQASTSQHRKPISSNDKAIPPLGVASKAPSRRKAFVPNSQKNSQLFRWLALPFQFVCTPVTSVVAALIFDERNT